jgi:glycosyltransferase involved in cell wall biosynthesis
VKVALVHDWLVTYRGGEKVLEAMLELFPSAEIFTLFHEPRSTSTAIEAREIHTSFLDRVPGARQRYRHLLPLFPWAIEALSLEGFDLVLSSSHCVAKGVRKPRGVKHLSYVHAPMRYMWDRFDDYFGPGRAPMGVRAAAHAVRPLLREWDRKTAREVDAFVANSHFIASRIQECYGREATVIHPPVELDRFASLPLEGAGRKDYFLWLGALAPYKRADLAIEAFRRLGRPLWLAGDGQEARALSKNLPPNVKLLGRVSDDDLPKLYQGARAFIFTGEEDFGLTPIEAMATGRPVIAFAKGGALETVTPRTGFFFSEQTPESLVAAVVAFDAWEASFRPDEARAWAMQFSKAAFQRRFRAAVDAMLSA